MEGDAGASRLNPTDADDSSPTEVMAEDSSESEDRTDQAKTEVVALPTAEADDETSESDVEDTELSSEEAASEDDASSAPVDERGPSRLGRVWVVGIAALLLVLGGGVGFGGYLALKAHQKSQNIEHENAAAIRAAKDCVTVIEAPDTNAMATAASKMIDCSTGDFREQAVFWSSFLAEAYQAANVHLQVADMRAAVEHTDDDGTVVMLFALRTKVTNSDAADQEQGYRLRVWMKLAEGQYKVSRLDSVAK